MSAIQLIESLLSHFLSVHAPMTELTEGREGQQSQHESDCTVTAMFYTEKEANQLKERVRCEASKHKSKQRRSPMPDGGGGGHGSGSGKKKVSFGNEITLSLDGSSGGDGVKSQPAMKNKTSVFYDDTSGFTNKKDNTIQREQFPARNKARCSNFRMKDNKPMAVRKQSTYLENAFGQNFRLAAEQLQMIQTGSVWRTITTELEEIGIATYDAKELSLKLILSEAANRDKAVQILQSHLGSLSGVADVPSKEVIFPLSDKQLRMVTNEHHLKMLMDDMTHVGTIGVDQSYLKLQIPHDLPTITPVHKLEKRLGVLLAMDEIRAIRDGIRGDANENAEQNIDVNAIDVLKLDDQDFVNTMMQTCENGVSFIKHKKKGVYDQRFVGIHNDRLFWKEKQDERNHRSRSMLLTKITAVLIGKNTQALMHETLEHIPKTCCCSVMAKKATLDLSTPTKDPIEVRKFVSYLTGLQRHFISQANEFLNSAGQQHRQPHANANNCNAKNDNSNDSSKHHQSQKRKAPNSAQSGKMKG